MKKLPDYIIFLVICVVTFASAYAQTSAQIEQELLGHLNNLEKYSMYSGTGDENALDIENKALKEKLLKYSRRVSTLKYRFKALDDKIRIVTSQDGKFRVYSWDSESGGTMHDHKSVFQYQGKSGKVYSWSFPETEEFNVGGFYHQIFQLDTDRGPVYLANSTFILSNPLAMQELELYRIDGERLNTKVNLIRTKSGLKGSVGFEYDFFSVVDRPERPIKLFFFDEAAKSFRFPIVVEDKEFINGGKVTDKFITYKFNGKYFVKVS